MEELVEIFTDGACKGNPGPGGWAAILRCRSVSKIISGGEHRTTNNRMEMTAAIMALEALKRPCKVKITTDSQYLMLGITQWIKSWKKKSWRTSTNSPVKNIDLWQRLDKAISRHEVQWDWVRGHNLHSENEMVDGLAKEAMKKFI